VHSLAVEEPLKGEGSGHPHGEMQGMGCFGIKSDEFGVSEHGPSPSKHGKILKIQPMDVPLLAHHISCSTFELTGGNQ